ncbi:MAG: 50S ribosomal protein L29 [Phycisphaerales bacterium]
MSSSEITRDLERQRAVLYELKLTHAVGALEKPHLLRAKRAQVARLCTILEEQRHHQDAAAGSTELVELKRVPVRIRVQRTAAHARSKPMVSRVDRVVQATRAEPKLPPREARLLSDVIGAMQVKACAESGQNADNPSIPGNVASIPARSHPKNEVMDAPRLIAKVLYLARAEQARSRLDLFRSRAANEAYLDISRFTAEDAVSEATTLRRLLRVAPWLVEPVVVGPDDRLTPSTERRLLKQLIRITDRRFDAYAADQARRRVSFDAYQAKRRAKSQKER